MGLKRILHFGNTEEIYRFCPEEILYMQAVNGMEETKVFLINHRDTYILPNGLGYVSKIIDDALLKTTNSMCRIGRSSIINLQYLSDIIGTDTVRLVAEVDGITTEENLRISVAACTKLAERRGVSKEAQKEYQRLHFEGGYIEKHIGGGGGYLGFIIKEYEPCARPERYYDINDDEIMFLGV